MDKHRKIREWQNAQIKNYELRAAKRLLANAVVFLVVYTLLMTFSIVASSMH
ncbi:hypothetical protein Mal15_55560 [Stieleria maiorica]|uniref:Uncharacterized protein n=1 Tax=Stieleria maiorica TaxID=2795974 RepID=A0A5B9MJT6_9BACT|nr:hypothetical protein [Stieleria maiorica]QEG01479.1 hypothetical protein Mal15_55560 [Stieleria maiorica]